LATKFGLTSMLYSIQYDYFKVNLVESNNTPTIKDTDLILWKCTDSGSPNYNKQFVKWWNGSDYSTTIVNISFVYNNVAKTWLKKNDQGIWVDSYAGEYFKRIMLFSNVNSRFICDYLSHVKRGRVTVNVATDDYLQIFIIV
jgi:hypothetical protein